MGQISVSNFSFFGRGVIITLLISILGVFTANAQTVWFKRQAPVTTELTSVVYGGGVFSAVAYGRPKALQSRDGRFWSASPLPDVVNQLSFFSSIQGPAFWGVGTGDARLVRASPGGAYMPRLDVDELLQSGGGQSLTSISSQGVRLGILGRQVDGELYTNILLFFNGTRWSSQSFQIPDQRTNSYLLADRLVVGGSVALLFSGAGNADRSSRVWYVDLAQLNSQNPELIEIAAPDGQSWGDLVAGSYGAGAFVLVGRAGKIHRISESAPSEVQRVDSGLSASLSGVAYGDKSGGRWVAVGACGTVLYSTSSRGDQWMQAPVRVLDDLNAVTYGAGTFLAVGEGGVILQSN